MSRPKVRAVSDICADCSAPDPKWASVNRGVLMCDECCSVHRSLGRHISAIKSLKKGSWSPALLSMVHQLVSNSANSIWEHTLHDATLNKHSRRKPNPRDILYPTKADFIRAKYQFLSFIKRQNDGSASCEDLSQQLHSCVRTDNLQTTLRLLALGANPNYFNPDKGNYPLHVAAQEGQTWQVELLVVYGGDPGAIDNTGKTPIQCARSAGQEDLASRLVECQYELTDRLAFYLCGRKPDHRSGQHFIIPEMSDSSLDLSELAKAAKKKLQALPNHLFEELAMDVYDEVDRRENETIWLSTQNHSTLVNDRKTVPFLPVNPEFSSTRNQGRQKLARFNAREFATLVIDILSDARKRQQGIKSPVHTPKEKVILKGLSGLDVLANSNSNVNKTNSFSDDEPNYDSVASDEDYSSVDSKSIRESLEMTMSNIKDKQDRIREQHQQQPNESMASLDQAESPVTLEEYLGVKKSLITSESRMAQLAQMNKDLRQEIHQLKNMVQKLMTENAELRADLYQNHVRKVQQNQEAQVGVTNGPVPVSVTTNGHDKETVQIRKYSADSEGLQGRSRQAGRPHSMFEPRNHHNLPWKKSYSDSLTQYPYPAQSKEDAISCQIKPMTPFRDDIAIRTGAASSSSIKRISLSEDDRESPSRGDQNNSDVSEYENDSRRESSIFEDVPEDPLEVVGTGSCLDSQATPTKFDGEEGLPTQQNVVKKTEKITKNIQELLISAQEGKHKSYLPCSEKIHVAVQDMADLFPQKLKSDALNSSLSQLTNGAEQLQIKCKSDTAETTDSSSTDYGTKTQQIIQCAYDIAKAAKRIVTLFEAEK